MDDRQTIRALVTELYAIVSGPGDSPRAWKRESELFMPDARMIRTVIDPCGEPVPEIIQASDYPDNFEAKMGGRDFHEVEVHSIIEVFGCIAHAFSTYEAYGDAAHSEFLKRGINSIQFYKVDGEWKISSMVWDDERPGIEMSERYCPLG